jgi:putative peptidoglycan lipid II flippase
MPSRVTVPARSPHPSQHEAVSDAEPASRSGTEPASRSGTEPDPLPLPHPDAGLEGREFVNEESRRIMRSSAVVAVGTALSRLTGFVRIAAIAYALGVTALAGTYSYANETPNIVYELLLGGVFTATLVPLFVKYFESDDEDAASAVTTVSMLALLAVTVLGVLFAPVIVRLYTLDVHGPGRANQQELATELLRLFMPQMLFYGIVALATAMLNAQRRFVAAAFAPILNNVVVIAVFLMLPRVASDSLSVHSVLDDDALVLLMGVGTTAGVAVMALALLPALRHARVHLRFFPAWRHAAVRTMLRVGGWTVGYVIANQVALFVVTVLAVGTKGGPFVYMAAYAFFQLPHGLFAVSLMTTFSPELARAAARDDIPAMRSQLSRALRVTTAVIVPAAALYIGLARPLIVTLLQRGAFSGGDASIVADTLVAFAVGLLPFSIYLFSLRAFTSRLDTFTPFWINCIENAINVALAFGLYAWLGVPGLALAFSLAYFCAAVLALVVVDRRLHGIEGRALATTIVKSVGAGAVAAGASWLVADAIGWSTTGEALASLVLGGLAGVAVYIGVATAARLEELRALYALLPARLRART